VVFEIKTVKGKCGWNPQSLNAKAGDFF